MSADKGPHRSCVACRETKPQGQLVRYVVAPDGALVVDYRNRLPGRGAYTCIDLECLHTAVERKQFQRSFKGKCKNAELSDLTNQLTSALEQKIVSLLGMGRKSGQVVSGTNAIMTGLRQASDFALVIVTNDISTAIAEKLQSLAAHHKVECSQMLTKDLLGQILGKGERSAVAVQKGTLADAILIELQRYKQLVREN
ncbi:LSU ribosomal protein L7AE [Malonomonas rubra DSM 5091]|uniref:LSU ribosomal protein L7AE n=1 Tax=Malonomonas rubra DSM 5091 TaxID=1122189 RepID=A0A1M6KHC2_MALRU|nr:YlxR family protein [Malonomonas rubra]SHJ58307.1 LSU ribosomal protein L7AE [Malonomonas rubra DSM 5091]